MSQYPVAQVVGGQQGGVVGVVSQPSDVNLDIGGRVERMQNELDVPEQIVRDLLSVAGADIVVIADDSGSMGAVANYVTRSTRWTELRDTLQKLAHMLLVVDHTDGFHIQFLNDPTWHEIRSGSQVETLFYGRQPKGRTPLATRLRPLLSGQWHPKGHGAETDLILIVMTDGSPSDVDFGGLTRLVAGKKANGGSNCLSPQVVLLADGWPQKDAFLDEVAAQIAAQPTWKAYYPGAAGRRDDVLQAYGRARLGDGNDDVALLDVGVAGAPGFDGSAPAFSSIRTVSGS